MVKGKQRRSARRADRRHRRELLALALLVPAASCVPEAARLQSAGTLAAISIDLPPEIAANAMDGSVTLASTPLNLAVPAAAIEFHADTSLDRMRALDCLAEAVYYEARSESEEGQRAVAQVVLNRVRHPAFPRSVCGVVYQGPMKAGGGCQFTFTCDGSLARRPLEPGWSRARRIAAEALSGQVFAPVGHATHYHTLSVAPDWAPRLARTALIGAHIFYRWPGAAGTSTAFTQAYSGHEPSRPPLVRYASMAPVEPVAAAPTRGRVAYAPLETVPVLELTPNRLPQSRVRPEYLNSGTWKTP